MTTNNNNNNNNLIYIAPACRMTSEALKIILKKLYLNYTSGRRVRNVGIVYTAAVSLPTMKNQNHAGSV